jgi:hypothetical protein
MRLLSVIFLVLVMLVAEATWLLVLGRGLYGFYLFDDDDLKKPLPGGPLPIIRRLSLRIVDLNLR